MLSSFFNKVATNTPSQPVSFTLATTSSFVGSLGSLTEAGMTSILFNTWCPLDVATEARSFSTVDLASGSADITTINILLNDFPWILSLLTHTSVDSLGEVHVAKMRVAVKMTKRLFFIRYCLREPWLVENRRYTSEDERNWLRWLSSPIFIKLAHV